MKKLLLLLLPAFLCLSLCGQPQQIKIVSFTVKNQLPANIDSWNNIPGSLLLIAQIPPGVRIPGIRLVVQIKSGGAVICGNNSTGGIQVDNFTTRTFSAAELTGALTGCHELKDGSYTICVQFFNGERKEASQEMCKEFRVETPKETDFTPPTLITPENEKNFAETELSRPVSFRWTPLVPKPREPVTYRLKVWQLMQGQNGTQAMRTNQPIVTKDVDNITQAVVSGIYTGPCRPPYLCDFIWQVQALNKEGKPIGRNEGNSEPYVFKIKQNVQGELKNTFPENEKQFSASDVQKAINFRWTPLVPKPQEPVTYRLKVWQLMQGQNGSQAMRTNKPIVTKDVADITEAVVSGIYTGPCRPPYLCDFVWNVEATTRNAAGSEPHTISTSEPFVFSVKENETQSGIKNVFPENEKQFKPADAIKPISFRWTPLVPKPQEPVTYRLRVWQLMQGQSGSQAMKTNPPIITRDVADITEATISGIYTGPCRPPYLCDYIWEVQAVTRTGTNAGNSEPTTFSVTDQKGKRPGNELPEDKKEITPEDARNTITFRWTPVVPKPQEPVTYRLRVWQLMQGQSGSQAMRTNKPIITKDVADITEAIVSGIYTGPCKPPYLCDYVWQVEVISRNGSAGTTSELTTFNIKAPSESEIILPVTEYAAPNLAVPENRKKVMPRNIGEPVLFKWTAIAPKPAEPVTYRLRVWQLMQGQSGSQAMRTNQPIVTKEVADITEATVSNIYTGPCRPPYLCDFIWNVQAITNNGMAVSTSKTFHFEIVVEK
jgi:hypothetical protein